MNSYDSFGRSTERTETDEQLLEYINQPAETVPAEVNQRAQETALEITPPPETEASEGLPSSNPVTPKASEPAVAEEQTDPNTERLDGLDGFLEDSAVEIRDWIDNKLQGDQQSCLLYTLTLPTNREV